MGLPLAEGSGAFKRLDHDLRHLGGGVLGQVLVDLRERCLLKLRRGGLAVDAECHGRGDDDEFRELAGLEVRLHVVGDFPDELVLRQLVEIGLLGCGAAAAVVRVVGAWRPLSVPWSRVGGLSWP